MAYGIGQRKCGKTKQQLIRPIGVRRHAENVSYQQDGFEIVPDVIAPAERLALLEQLPGVAPSEAGSRDLLDAHWCRDLAVALRAHSSLASLLPQEFVAVQCTYFSKTEATNWLVAYHQDLSIPVLARVEAPSCTGWSVKQGVTFVQPSVSVLKKLVAVRVHLDDSNASNGPLRVIPGSHRNGRVAADQMAAYRSQAREVACVVPECGALVFSPLLLHASSKSQSCLPRRVLHFLFGPRELPEGLAWCAAV